MLSFILKNCESKKQHYLPKNKNIFWKDNSQRQQVLAG
jgi:hypothetical protein